MRNKNRIRLNENYDQTRLQRLIQLNPDDLDASSALKRIEDRKTTVEDAFQRIQTIFNDFQWSTNIDSGKDRPFGASMYGIMEMGEELQAEIHIHERNPHDSEFPWRWSVFICEVFDGESEPIDFYDEKVCGTYIELTNSLTREADSIREWIKSYDNRARELNDFRTNESFDGNTTFSCNKPGYRDRDCNRISLYGKNKPDIQTEDCGRKSKIRIRIKVNK